MGKLDEWEFFGEEGKEKQRVTDTLLCKCEDRAKSLGDLELSV